MADFPPSWVNIEFGGSSKHAGREANRKANAGDFFYFLSEEANEKSQYVSVKAKKFSAPDKLFGNCGSESKNVAPRSIFSSLHHSLIESCSC